MAHTLPPQSTSDAAAAAAGFAALGALVALGGPSRRRTRRRLPLAPLGGDRRASLASMAQRVPAHAAYADLLALPANVVGEIVFGMLHSHPRPRPMHARVASRLGVRLGGPFDRDEPGGWVLLDEPELHLGPHVVVPDLAGWRRERMPEIPIDKAYFEVPPDWCCEVLSTGTEALDRGDKKRIYEAFMVEHLWLVDVEEQTVEVHALRGSAYELTQTVRGGEAYELPPFEGFALTLGDLWAR